VAPARYLPRSPPNYWRGPPSLMGGGEGLIRAEKARLVRPPER